MSAPRLYGTIWRWHFYAGLFVLPFILMLSVTGSIYLFKPQIDRWEERDYHALRTVGAVSPDRQVSAALASYRDGHFGSYRLPEERGDAAMIQLSLPGGEQRQVFVSPQGKVLGALVPDERISDVVGQVHGSLLLGTWGDWLVELAASWTIVMILSGLYLWWPRPLQLAGTLWPRLTLRGRPLLKDLHRVTGFWIAGLVLVMLASGLPWAGVWGSAFKWVRTELGATQRAQDWKIGAKAPAAEHDHAAMMGMPAAPKDTSSLPLAVFVRKAEHERMSFPVLVIPPHAPRRFGPPSGNEWTVVSESQNRPLDRHITYDPVTGSEIERSGFADKHVIDRIVNTGIAWHEGQLFGLANQIMGVATALALVAVSILGSLLWLKRRPTGELGAPSPARGMRTSYPLLIALIMLGALLPLFGASLLLILAIDRLLRAWSRGERGHE
jgi:uncharacterized iron-regulated membrane protein